MLRQLKCEVKFQSLKSSFCRRQISHMGDCIVNDISVLSLLSATEKRDVYTLSECLCW